MNKDKQTEKLIIDYVNETMIGDAAHDLAHIDRVVKTAKVLCENESANMAVVMPAAWLHDCYIVAKNHPDRSIASRLSAERAIQFLTKIHYDEKYLDDIYHAIEAHSFSANIKPKTLEAKIVQDADRLDALGAIGIARLMQVSGALQSALYHPSDPFCQNRAPDDKTYAVDHFYKKLFHLKSMLNTNAAKDEAQRRCDFIDLFLKQLAREIS